MKERIKREMSLAFKSNYLNYGTTKEEVIKRQLYRKLLKKKYEKERGKNYGRNFNDRRRQKNRKTKENS
jgi:hypothetical protein